VHAGLNAVQTALRDKGRPNSYTGLWGIDVRKSAEPIHFKLIGCFKHTMVTVVTDN